MKEQEASDCVVQEKGMKRVLAAMSRNEKMAWLLLVVSGVSVVQIGWRLFSTAGTMEKSTGYYFWYLFWVGYFLFIRKDKTLPMDERDRVIQAQGGRAGYVALMLMLLVISVLVDTGGYRDFVASCTGYWLAEFLLWLIFLSVGLQAMVMVWHYWRDRQ